MQKNEILKIYGTDYKNQTIALLEHADLASEISDLSLHIGIKPNLVTPTPASYGATTHSEIIAGIVEYLQSYGFFNITILEGSWVGDKTSEAFEYCGYNDLAKKYNVKLVNTQKDASVKVSSKSYKLNICESVNKIDFLINVPVLKGHCQTKITCALKNMKGLIPNSEKRRFHTLGLHEPIARLNSVIHQDFIVVDNICGDLDFEEGGNPVISNCIMAAKDPVLVDAHVCTLLGYDVKDVPYIVLSESLGIGSSDVSSAKITVISGAEDTIYAPEKRVLDVSYAADDIDSCSACYAMLVPALLKLKEEGLLDKLPCKIAIGQGHKNKSGLLGVGNCTSSFKYSVKGCPPSDNDIYSALKDFILNL
jgi:uncharacterized protein (DUF362 family)